MFGRRVFRNMDDASALHGAAGHSVLLVRSRRLSVVCVLLAVALLASTSGARAEGEDPPPDHPEGSVPPPSSNNDRVDSERESNGGRLFGRRSRAHIEKILRLQSDGDDPILSKTLDQIASIYKKSIKPLEEAYKYNDLNRHIINEAEIYAIPRVVVVGPWSTGKSSLINYLLGVENTTHALLSGAQPTTSDFTVLSYGPEFKSVEGIVMVMDSAYAPLEKFGQKFLDKFLGVKVPSKLLKKLSLIDTPGIIENRKQQERGYPFSDVCQWFLERCDMIVVMFDPTKLDVGGELETLFHQLRGHEAKVRIILNKADTIDPQELMRIYGALFWSLAPLVNVTEPPRVYVGSFWSKGYDPVSEPNGDLFFREEVDLLSDLQQAIANRLENKIALVRQHAVLVRNHALLVDQYLQTLQRHKSIFKDSTEVAAEIARKPQEYRVFQAVLGRGDVSRRDLPSPEDYEDFFAVHPMDSFQPLGRYCDFFGNCYLDTVDYAISRQLPALLEEVEAHRTRTCKVEGSVGGCQAKGKFGAEAGKAKYYGEFNRG